MYPRYFFLILLCLPNPLKLSNKQPIMKKPKIPAALRRLFDSGMIKDKEKPREYRFYDVQRKEKTAPLGEDNLLAER
jgi:hypothetical protein